MRLHLEVLEDRTVPTVFFVVSPNSSPVSPDFSSLAGAVNAAATSGDTIQIEPGSVPGTATTGFKVLTLQGDPAYGPATLPAISDLLLQSANNVVFGLNVTTLQIVNGATGQTITNCLVQNLTETGGIVPNGNNVISTNTITGSMAVGNSQPGITPVGGDTIFNNTFLSSAGSTTLLNVTQDNGAVIQGNNFKSLFNASIAIQVENSTPLTVANNNITLSGAGSVGVEVDNPGATTTVTVDNNRINTSGQGTGILTEKTANLTLSVSIAGNDLVGNHIGLNVQGDGSALGTIDAGNGPLGSLGGNDFHGYLSTAGGSAAIEVSTGSGTVSAELNIFSVAAGNVVISQGGLVDVGSELSANQAFVQILYNDMLGRTGSLGELNGWVNSLPSIGQEGVASQIIHSAEADYRVVNGLYATFLGREGTTAEEAGWVSIMTSGGTEEQVMAGILGSAEFAAHAIVVAPLESDGNTDFVQALYLLLLSRAGGSSELSGWVSALPTLGKQGVIDDFLNSAEFRGDVVESLYSGNAAFTPPSFFDTLPNMLHRPEPPSAAEEAFWVNSNFDILNIELGIAASAEFVAGG